MSGTKKDEETTAFFQVPEGLLRRARGEDAAPDTERQPGALRATPSTSVPAAAPMSSPSWDEPTAPSGQTVQDYHLAVAGPVSPTPPPVVVPTRPPQRPLVDPPRLRRTSSRPLEPLPELAPKNEGLLEEDTLVNFQPDELLRQPKK
jgi:hypothetical protein